MRWEPGRCWSPSRNCKDTALRDHKSMGIYLDGAAKMHIRLLITTLPIQWAFKELWAFTSRSLLMMTLLRESHCNPEIAWLDRNANFSGPRSFSSQPYAWDEPARNAVLDRATEEICITNQRSIPWAIEAVPGSQHLWSWLRKTVV